MTPSSAEILELYIQVRRLMDAEGYMDPQYLRHCQEKTAEAALKLILEEA